MAAYDDPTFTNSIWRYLLGGVPSGALPVNADDPTQLMASMNALGNTKQSPVYQNPATLPSGLPDAVIKSITTQPSYPGEGWRMLNGVQAGPFFQGSGPWPYSYAGQGTENRQNPATGEGPLYELMRRMMTPQSPFGQSL